ncbi:MAG: AraC family transcriptional regulator, partial [Paenibacillus sp.]|nr:AraC family transcriptional regulator [Paenibacillus sp.]
MLIRSFNHHTLHPGYTGNAGGIHPCFELLYATEGRATLEWMGSDYPIAAPGLYLFTPNTPHRLTRFMTPFSFWFIELDMNDPQLFPTDEQALQWNR